MSLSIPPSARQRNRERWSMGAFREQWTLVLGAALERSTAHSSFYPDIRSIRSSELVNRTLAGCTKMYGSPAKKEKGTY